MLMRTDPFREADRLAEQLWGRTSPAIPMDAVRHEGQVFVSFDLPGVDPASIDLTVERNVLTVRAERRFEKGEDDEVIANERRYGTFARQVFLGDTLDTGRLEASYDHGVLTVMIPLAEQAQPRRITIGGADKAEAIEAESRETVAG